MSESTGDEPSYFDLSRRQVKASTGSEAVSPLTAPTSSSPVQIHARVTRPRLLQELRSRSDLSLTRIRPRVQTIEEETTSYSSRLSVPGHRASFQGQLSNTIRSKASSSSSKQPIEGEIVQNVDLELRSNQSSQHKTSKKDHSHRGFRVRSRPRSEGFRGQTSGSNYETSGVAQDDRLIPTVEAPYAKLQPLRPPVRTHLTASRSNPHIKIEKSFTTVEPEVSDPKPSKQPSQRSRRSSSINPKQIFSASVKIFRRKQDRPDIHPDSEEELRPAKSKAFVADFSDHQTNFRKEAVAAGLKRVSYILQDVGFLGSQGRTASDKTASTATSRSWASWSRHGKTNHVKSLERARSMDLHMLNADSPGSSMRRLQMGVTPNNTPEEKATYTVFDKNGNPTEYLKLDISVRGQTSYLPSEARRIHTPPLPSHGLDGRARGFFFDYNTPSNPEETILSTPNTLQIKHKRSSRSDKSRSSAASHVPTISRRYAATNFEHDARVKTGDWYSAQFSEPLDSSSEHEEGDFDLHSGTVSDVPSLIEGQEELDHNIPEHLPTSPLCPRHPRYWRIVKNKGSQFRGCWMHGFGVFSGEEQAKYGI